MRSLNHNVKRRMGIGGMGSRITTKVESVEEKKKETVTFAKKQLDLTEVLSCFAIAFMLFRIAFLIRAMMQAPPLSSQYSSDWLAQMSKVDSHLDYSRMEPVRTSSGRTFLKYTPSPWEIKWSSSMDDFVRTGTVCSQISFDTDLIRSFFNATCTNKAQEQDLDTNNQGWCKIDDAQQPIFFNVNNGKVSGARPAPLKSTEFYPAQPVTVDQPQSPVFSKFVYRDDDTGIITYEYVEPLVSRLRHPLDCCEYAYKIGANFKKPPPNCLVTQRLGVSRTQYIPPAHNDGFAEAHFFDSGSIHWVRAKSPLAWVTNIWKRHGIHFSHYHVYEARTSEQNFLSTVPEEIKPKVDFRIASNAQTTDFVNEIVTQTTPDDYVIFRLALGDTEAEMAVLNELLENRLNVLDYLDEFLYTIPIPQNISADVMEYGPWYKRFMRLRQEGVRAHSFSEEGLS